MLSFGFIDPFAPLDPLWGGVEFLCNLVDILRLPACNLNEGIHPHLVQGPRKGGADAMNLTQVVFLCILYRFRLFDL